MAERKNEVNGVFKMQLKDLLNLFLEKSGDTKNGLIEKTRIDRSTFFQILNGRRFPTEIQIRAIADNMRLSDIDKNLLMETYTKEVLGNDSYYGDQFVKKTMKIIADSKNGLSASGISFTFNNEIELKQNVYSGYSEIKNVIEQILMHEMLVSKKRLDIFVPISLMINLDMLHTLRLFGRMDDVSTLFCRQLIEFPTGNIFYDENSINILSIYLDFILTNKMNYKAYYYYADTGIRSNLGIPFPYYIITSDKVLLLSRDGDTMIILDDEKVYKTWCDEYDDLINVSDALVNDFDSKEEYVKIVGAREEKKLYIMEFRPGISFMMTDELMEKYIPEQLRLMLYQHAKCFIGGKYMELTTMQGIKEFREDCSIDEAGFKLKAEKEDVEYVVGWMKKRLHKTLEIIDTDKLPLSRNWAISVIEDENVILVPYLTTDKIIYITEKNIVHAFTVFMHNLADNGYLLDDSKMNL